MIYDVQLDCFIYNWSQYLSLTHSSQAFILFPKNFFIESEFKGTMLSQSWDILSSRYATSFAQLNSFFSWKFLLRFISIHLAFLLKLASGSLYHTEPETTGITWTIIFHSYLSSKLDYIFLYIIEFPLQGPYSFLLAPLPSSLQCIRLHFTGLLGFCI